ncbi:MAG: endonuclease domain-containing protein [Spirochaetota bacterium]
MQEQFKLCNYQYFWEGAKEWTADRVNELQILKDIAFKIINFISQSENELVKIWNKPKFVKNPNYVITLDRKKDITLIEKIVSRKKINEQVKECQELGIVGNDFTHEEIFENYEQKDWDSYNSNVMFKNELIKQGLITTGFHLPYNPRLVEAARQLRKNMTPAEKKLWYEYLRNFKYPVLRQRPIHHFIVDFYCAKLKLVIEIDGEQHYTEEGKTYDEERTKILEGYGLRVIRFSNKEVINDFEKVCKKIENIPPYPPFNSPLRKRGYRGGCSLTKGGIGRTKIINLATAILSPL